MSRRREFTPLKLAAALTLAVGCGAPRVPVPADADPPDPSATGTGSASTSGPGTSPVTTDPAPEPDVPEPGTDFIASPDGFGSIECSVWEEDCPPGFKCMPWANDGGNAWNATRCSPIAPDPDAVGEPCTVEGSAVSGVDSCELHAMCWDVGTDTNEGTCVAMCVGSEADPGCEDPDQYCPISAEGVLLLCLDTCDPVAPACSAGDGCYPTHDRFVCAPDASGRQGAAGDPCEFLNACDPALVCVNASIVAGCTGASGCCARACGLDDPTPPCRLELGETCRAWFEDEQAPPGYEHVGVCGLPD